MTAGQLSIIPGRDPGSSNKQDWAPAFAGENYRNEDWAPAFAGAQFG